MTTHAQVKAPGTPTWVDLLTPDIDAARSFYRELFGWEYNISGAEYGGYSTARVGTRAAAGLSGPMPGAPPAPTAWSLYFASHDLESDVSRAVDLGAKVVSPAFAVEPFGSMATLEDPTGAQFSFWQAKEHIGAEITDEPGGPAWYELYTPNAQQASDFYTALLGATAERMPGDMEYYVLKHGADQIAGIMQIDPAWGDFATQWVTYFAVPNADDAVATITRLGGKVMGPIDDSPYGRIAAVADPSGAIFKIVEPPQS
jgi:predicted enzyme related to lactoylglutathione lyase